mmetsp:Transcript_10188/g.19754  ORF Transcript_10188/g.19754 Transcript_10188/m.19754 type:complete len:266 (+) Transcript_10188:151-948(+)
MTRMVIGLHGMQTRHAANRSRRQRCAELHCTRAGQLPRQLHMSARTSCSDIITLIDRLVQHKDRASLTTIHVLKYSQERTCFDRGITFRLPLFQAHKEETHLTTRKERGGVEKRTTKAGIRTSCSEPPKSGTRLKQRRGRRGERRRKNEEIHTHARLFSRTLFPPNAQSDLHQNDHTLPEGSFRKNIETHKQIHAARFGFLLFFFSFPLHFQQTVLLPSLPTSMSKQEHREKRHTKISSYSQHAGIEKRAPRLSLSVDRSSFFLS